MERAIGFSRPRRRVLGDLLGLGAALSVPSRLFGLQSNQLSCDRWPNFYEKPFPGCRGRQIFFENPVPERLVVAEEFRPGQTPGNYDVRAFGAVGDGKALDTRSINKAIEAAAARGGGTVCFPPGTYLCFSIRLRSNVVLHLGQGATIVGKAYDPAEPGADDNKYDDHWHGHNALIWGDGIENVSILGPGLLWGKGLTRGRGGQDETIPGVGSMAISLRNCRHVTIRDLSILHGGSASIQATGVDNFTIDNLLIDTNKDGIRIDSCRNVRVSNCTINSPWDDAIVPKSSYALGYARSTENVTITNCFVTGGYHEGTVLNGAWKEFEPGASVLRVGRIKFGTGSIGGFKNITISNCVFEKCGGLLLETVDGALLEDISVTNITMRDISDVPVFMRLGSCMRGPADVPVGKLRRVNISNVVASNTAGRYASLITGIPGHLIENIKLSNIYIQSQGGGTKEDAVIELPEMENAYPEPSHFGTDPAYGFYVRHVKGLEMSHVEVELLEDDARPAFVFHDVHGVNLLRIKAKLTPGIPTITVRNASDFNLDLSPPLPDEHLANVRKRQL
jgi:polygalacturonase